MEEFREPVAVIGAGTIGLSWAAFYACRGHPVRVADPRDDLAETMRASLPRFLAQIALLGGGYRAPASITACGLAEAVEDVVAVQECGPEDLEFKQRVFVEIEEAAPTGALLISSSSGIVASHQAKRMRRPERLIIGHPFNPPHILPLVEVSADDKTAQSYIDPVLQWYRGLGKIPVQLTKEIPGFVANRLQMALLTEAFKLVKMGVVNPVDLDAIVMNSLGVRWASIGPILAFHLGGGSGGLRNMLENIGLSLAEAIGQELTPETIDAVSTATEESYPIPMLAAYAETRDRRQSGILTGRRYD